MSKYNAVLAEIDKPDGKEYVVKKYQSTGDIIKDLIACFKDYNYQAKPATKLFYTGNTIKDGRNIYDFIKNNIQYSAEPEKDQTTRSFTRIIHDKWGDCKHSALLAASLGWQMGYTVIFKFVNYEDNSNSFGHVYTLLEKPNTNERVIIDPLQEFNYQKRYKRAVNYKAINHNNSNMTLSRLSGENDDQSLKGIGTIYDVPGMAEVRIITGDDLMEGVGKAKKALVKPLLKATATAAKHPIKSALHPVKTARSIVAPKTSAKANKKQADKKQKRKTKHGELKAKIKARGGLLKTVSLAPIRAAGTVLILANFRNFAGRMKTMLSKSPGDIAAFAKKFGYNPDVLKKQIEKGSKKKPLFGSKANGIAGIGDVALIEGIGVVSVAAAITTAAPIILALTQLFKKHGIEEPADTVAMAESLENIKSAPDVAAEGGDAETEDAVYEEVPAGEEEETVEGGNKKKFADTLTKIEVATKAANAAARATQKTKAVTKPIPKKQEEEMPEEAKGFFAKAIDHAKEHPLWWIGGGVTLVWIGGKLIKVHKSKR